MWNKRKASEVKEHLFCGHVDAKVQKNVIDLIIIFLEVKILPSVVDRTLLLPEDNTSSPWY